MRIILNGKPEELPANLDIETLLVSRNIDLSKVVVEYNETIIKSSSWKATIIQEDDRLEILSFVGGG